MRPKSECVSWSLHKILTTSSGNGIGRGHRRNLGQRGRGNRIIVQKINRLGSNGRIVGAGERAETLDSLATNQLGTLCFHVSFLLAIKAGAGSHQGSAISSHSVRIE